MTTQTQIASFAELKSFLSASNAKENQHFLLTADIDCGREPLGKLLHLASGSVFDGGGHAILNLKADENGIFDLATNGKIIFRNLTFGSADAPVEICDCLVNGHPKTDLSANGDSEETVWENVNAYACFTNGESGHLGVFFGNTVGKHSFRNCHVSVNVNTTNAVIGGFIGRYYGTSVVFEDCSVNGKLQTADSSVDSHVGGFIGVLGEKSDTKTTVTLSMSNCVNDAIVNATVAAACRSFAGGFIGAVWDSRRTLNIRAALKNCVNNGDISSNVSAGGLIGSVHHFSPEVTFHACINNACVSGLNATTSFAGGLIGLWNSVNGAHLDACINNGRVCEASYLGGMVGQAERGLISFHSCQNTGDIVATAGSHMGGLTGRLNENAIFQNCINTGKLSCSDGNKVGNMGQMASKVTGAVRMTNCYGLGAFDCDATNCGALIACVPADFIYSQNKYLQSEHINQYHGVDTEAGCLNEIQTDELIKAYASKCKTTDSAPCESAEQIWNESFHNVFPFYQGGTVSTVVFTNNIGYAKIKRDLSSYKMVSAYGTTQAEFDAYVEKLKADGCTVKQANAVSSAVTGYWVQKGDIRMYMYFSAQSGDARFILDIDDTQTTIEDFSYSYEKKPGDTTTYYLYGIKMNPYGVNIRETYFLLDETKYPELAAEFNPKVIEKKLVEFNEETGKWEGKRNLADKNCGMTMVLKLADNSVVLIDGGEKAQMSQEAGIHFNEFLHEITGTPMGEKVIVRCWFLTHCHGDHFGGFIRFMVNFHDQYKVERVMHNLREDSPPWLIQFHGSDFLQGYYPDIKFHRLHTGETIRLGDVEIDVIFTHEDLIDSKVGTFFSADSNDTSTVLRFRFDGKSVMALGDLANCGETAILKLYRAGDLKSDVMQVPHHGWNNLPDLFAAINPQISFFAQSSGGARMGLRGGASKTYASTLASTTGGKNSIYYAGDETVGVGVVNGEMTDVFHEKVYGAAWDGSDGGAESFWEDFDLFLMNK